MHSSLLIGSSVISTFWLIDWLMGPGVEHEHFRWDSMILVNLTTHKCKYYVFILSRVIQYNCVFHHWLRLDWPSLLSYPQHCLHSCNTDWIPLYTTSHTEVKPVQLTDAVERSCVVHQVTHGRQATVLAVTSAAATAADPTDHQHRQWRRIILFVISGFSDRRPSPHQLQQRKGRLLMAEVYSPKTNSKTF